MELPNSAKAVASQLRDRLISFSERGISLSQSLKARLKLARLPSSRGGETRLYEELPETICLQVGTKAWPGVPLELRRELWVSALHGRDPETGLIGTRMLDMFLPLSVQELPVEVVSDIDKDLKRTFPQYEFFCSEDGQQQLRSVLRAYAAHDPEVAYCQGMSFIAGLLLLFLNTPAEAFAALVLLMRRGLRAFYVRSMSLLQVQLWQLGRLMSPKLCQHLESCGVVPMLYASSWLMTGYSADFPISFSGRVLDVTLTDRCPHALLKVAVAILKRCERKLLQMSDLEEILKFLKLEVPKWSEYELSDVLANAFSKPWVTRQLAILKNTENVETVAQGMERVLDLQEQQNRSHADEEDDEEHGARGDSSLPRGSAGLEDAGAAFSATGIPILAPPPSTMGNSNSSSVASSLASGFGAQAGHAAAVAIAAPPAASSLMLCRSTDIGSLLESVPEGGTLTSEVQGVQQGPHAGLSLLSAAGCSSRGAGAGADTCAWAVPSSPSPLLLDFTRQHGATAVQAVLQLHGFSAAPPADPPCLSPHNGDAGDAASARAPGADSAVPAPAAVPARWQGLITRLTNDASGCAGVDEVEWGEFAQAAIKRSAAKPTAMASLFAARLLPGSMFRRSADYPAADTPYPTRATQPGAGPDMEQQQPSTHLHRVSDASSRQHRSEGVKEDDDLPAVRGISMPSRAETAPAAIPAMSSAAAPMTTVLMCHCAASSLPRQRDMRSNTEGGDAEVREGRGWFAAADAASSGDVLSGGTRSGSAEAAAMASWDLYPSAHSLELPDSPVSAGVAAAAAVLSASTCISPFGKSVRMAEAAVGRSGSGGWAAVGTATPPGQPPSPALQSPQLSDSIDAACAAGTQPLVAGASGDWGPSCTPPHAERMSPQEHRSRRPGGLQRDAARSLRAMQLPHQQPGPSATAWPQLIQGSPYEPDGFDELASSGSFAGGALRDLRQGHFVGAGSAAGSFAPAAGYGGAAEGSRGGSCLVSPSGSSLTAAALMQFRAPSPALPPPGYAAVPVEQLQSAGSSYCLASATAPVSPQLVAARRTATEAGGWPAAVAAAADALQQERSWMAAPVPLLAAQDSMYSSSRLSSTLSSRRGSMGGRSMQHSCGAHAAAAAAVSAADADRAAVTAGTACDDASDLASGILRSLGAFDAKHAALSYECKLADSMYADSPQRETFFGWASPSLLTVPSETPAVEDEEADLAQQLEDAQAGGVPQSPFYRPGPAVGFTSPDAAAGTVAAAEQQQEGAAAAGAAATGWRPALLPRQATLRCVDGVPIFDPLAAVLADDGGLQGTAAAGTEATHPAALLGAYAPAVFGSLMSASGGIGGDWGDGSVATGSPHTPLVARMELPHGTSVLQVAHAAAALQAAMDAAAGDGSSSSSSAPFAASLSQPSPCAPDSSSGAGSPSAAASGMPAPALSDPLAPLAAVQAASAASDLRQVLEQAMAAAGAADPAIQPAALEAAMRASAAHGPGGELHGNAADSPHTPLVAKMELPRGTSVLQLVHAAAAMQAALDAATQQGQDPTAIAGALKSASAIASGCANTPRMSCEAAPQAMVPTDQ